MVVAAASSVGFWDWVERSSWIVGMAVGLIPAIFGIRAAMRARKADRGGDRTVGIVVGDNNTINQGDLITREEVFYQPRIVHVHNASNPPPGSGSSSGAPNDEWWVGPVLAAVAAIAVFVGYVTYRQWVLGFIAAVVAVTTLTAGITTALVFKLSARSVRVGLLLNLAALVVAFVLLLRLISRQTPYGTYDSIQRLVQEDGWINKLISAGGPVIFFVLLEVAALAYIFVVMLFINQWQMGLLAAIAAARRARFTHDPPPPGYILRNWAPAGRRGLYGRPAFQIGLLLFAWFFSSVTAIRLYEQATIGVNGFTR